MNDIINKIAQIIDPDAFAMIGDHGEGRCYHCDANRNEARSKAILIVEAMRQAPDISEIYSNYLCDIFWKDLDSKAVWNLWIDAILKGIK